MQKNNYVQIRFESCKNDKTIGMLKHNVRTQKPSYLRSNMKHNKEHNTLFIFDSKESFKMIENNNDIKKEYMKIKKHLMDYKETLKKENRSYREKKHALTQDSIITLSPSVNDMYENGEITKKELDNLFLKSVKNIEKELGLVAMYASVHYDEKTPHIHVSFQAYNKNNGKWQSVDSRGALKKQYSKAQDLVGNVFQEIGFERGKRGSKARHLSVQEMHQKEKENNLIDMVENIKTLDIKESKRVRPTRKIISTDDIEYKTKMFNNKVDRILLTTKGMDKIDRYIYKQNKNLENIKK